MLRRFLASAILATLSIKTGAAGTAMTYDAKESPIVEIPTESVVRESRGNITLEGPSGMFLNPTSATIPQGVWSAGFCSVLTNQDTEILGYSMFASYGVRDWLEVGVVANMFDFAINDEVPKGTYATAGPMARVRLMRDRDYWPEISGGGYAQKGTDDF